MQYLDPGNAQMRLPPLHRGPTFTTHHHNYASVQSSSLITPSSATSAPSAASTSVPINFREFQTEAANSQLKGNVPLRQDSGTFTSSHVSIGGMHGIMCQKNNTVGTGSVIRGVGFLPDGLYSGSVPQGTSSNSVTSCRQELNPLGNSSDISSQMSTSYMHASPIVTSSHPTQQSHNSGANQFVDQQNARAVQLKKSQQFLLMYHHALVCRKKEVCGLPQCPKFKTLIEHAVHCSSVPCVSSCMMIKKLIRHFKACVDPMCALCGPVKEVISKRSAKVDGERSKIHALPAPDEPEPKRIRIDQPNGMLCGVNTGPEKEVDTKVVSAEESVKELKVDSTHMELGCSVNEATKKPEVDSLQNSCVENSVTMKPGSKSAMDNMLAMEGQVETDSHFVVIESDNEVEIEPVGHVKKSIPPNIIPKDGTKFALAKTVDSCAIKITKETTEQRITGASLLDTFTLEEIDIHLNCLRICENKTQVTNEQSQLQNQMDQNTCSLCGMEELLFAPHPRYCGKCSTLIASHGVYYCSSETENKDCKFQSSAPISLCSRCHNVSGDLIKLPSGDVPKVCFEKRSNYAETDADAEWWVQCSKCDAWQHQICALFNGRRNQANVEHTCVTCFLKETENGKCKSLPLTKVLGAHDLPRTMLSDHIEKWLFTHLEIERQERATNLGKNIEEVPGVEGLCVRVVSSIDRVAYVKQNLREFLKDESYPSQFPYKSKAIVLFQKIEGVDVCLFAMYVQEYGSQCPLPNQRHTYISYIDSVKYFRPEIRSSSGEALRTFVYHGILIAYLDYCKKRGFVSCSLWACPPTKHDDYILYCHPTSQKMPKAEKLRGWYQAMITKAIKEKVVVERTNLYDYYLIPTNDWKTNVSAAHLPYCENDFWPGEAETILSNKEKGGLHIKESEPKGRTMRAAKRGLMDGKPDDIMLLHKLGERMRSLKEDFILIYMQPTCKHCRRAIVSGPRWMCTSCKNFLLCDRCYNEEEDLPLKDKHPASSKLKHEFQKVNDLALPATEDPDPCRECEFFDSRIDLLGLCQKKQYQFDTLRRAKHSTMMILYHLHTPSCSSCHTELEPHDVAWRCPTCSGYYMCSSCYRRGVSKFSHSHELVRLCEIATDTGMETYIGNAKGDRNAKGDSRITFEQLALETLLHASQCIRPRCEHRLCRKMKLLFRHSVLCKVRQRGGCLMCKKVWYLMQLHCCSCQDLDCKIARCKEIKDHISKLRLHSGS